MLKVTAENYYSAEADREYMSNSQFKGWLECPARQWAKMNGLWRDDEPIAFLVGKYVDVSLLTPDAKGEFMSANCDAITTKQGRLRADFETAEKMIARAKRDDLFMGSISGDTQALITWEMFGIKWRALIDVVDPERKTLVDLKTVRDFEPQWCPERKMKLPFYERFDYWRQLAIYREAYQAQFGHAPEVIAIAAVSKHEYPRLRVIQFDNQERFGNELRKIEAALPDVISYREANSADDVPACGQCDYCAENSYAKMEMAESLAW